jgi:hypothetical protein
MDARKLTLALFVAVVAALAPLKVNLSGAQATGLIDISSCSAYFDNCDYEQNNECASSGGGWVENYCTRTAVQPDTSPNCS